MGPARGSTVSSGQGVASAHSGLVMTTETATSKNEQTHCLE